MKDPGVRRFLERLRGPVPTVPAVVESLQIAGRAIQIRFGSAELAELLTRSLRHLRQPGGASPALTIDCWLADVGMTKEIPSDWARDGRTYMERDGCHLAWDALQDSLVIFDRESRHGWMRFGGLDSVLNWEVARPFRKLLHWWGGDHSLQMMHAAAVGHAEGGVLLAGRSGSGKSTTALACLAGGLAYAGDDYCLVETGRSPRVHAVYLSGVGDARTADLLPVLRERMLSAPRMPAQDSAKHLIFADDVAASSVTRGFPLRAIVLPQVTGGERSSLHPMSAADALRALAPSTVLQLPGKRAEGLARLGELVRSVPSWRLCLGGDPRTAVGVLANLLAEPAGASATGLTETAAKPESGRCST